MLDIVAAAQVATCSFLCRRDYSSVTASWQLTTQFDTINGFGLDPYTQQVYMATSQVLNTTYLVPYSRLVSFALPFPFFFKLGVQGLLVHMFKPVHRIVLSYLK